MNLVVNFLSMLGQEAETGGVHRMLGVCSEFERIAKVVIDKAEKDNTLRRKRKGPDPSSTTTSAVAAAAARAAATSTSAAATPQPSSSAPSQTSRPATACSSTPQPSHSQVNGHLSPSLKHQATLQNGYSPMTTTMSQHSSPAMAPSGWHSDLAGGNAMEGMEGANFPSFADLTGFGSIGNMNPAAPAASGRLHSPALGGANGIFTQPMLAPDVFTLPMTLDWDWAELSGGAYPSVENGNFGEGPRGR